ncbi:hypothetical protein [Nocardiopsis kunsanensis]|uniref:hypothetical protein n=1 Tax=Nocardiopsis kunsanensis TaxID=141693 RepID=UPI0018745521|nr:hypothetical protein [Nocardiopsis kunsanensis]
MRSFRKNPLIILTCTAILSLASSSVNAENGEDLPGPAEGNEPESQGLTVEAKKIKRNEGGNLISIDWSISNETDSDVALTWLHEKQTYTYNGDYYSGVTIVDPNTDTRHHPLMDQSGECVCAGNTSSRFYNQVVSGGESAYWSLFSTPSDVETLTLEVPGFEPIEDIPID